MKEAYVGYASNEELRASSTSGGICQIISKYIINQGGVVSGIYFDEEFNAVRGFARTMDELEKFNKSKYVQARQGDSYATVQKMLQDGEIVLFIGTPCQVRGLRCFLGKEFPKLVCLDFVCLGVPSEKVWHSYLAQISSGKRIASIDFKNKENGWRNFTFRVEFADGTVFREPGRQNAYMKHMIEKDFNRPACYQCTCRTLDRDSDITVADAWGTENIAPELIDDRGTSSIMVNSEKGKRLIVAIKDACRLKPVTVEELWERNQNAWKQYDRPAERDRFFTDMEQYGFWRSCKRLQRSKWKSRLKAKLKKLLH